MRQLDPPYRPAKQTRKNVLPWRHAKSTLEYDPPNSWAKDPPFPAQDPQAGHNSPASPPSPPRLCQRSGGRGWGADPARLRILHRYFCSPSCLHILTGHNIYAFYIERTIQYINSVALGEGKIARKGWGAGLLPAPIKGVFCIFKVL